MSQPSGPEAPSHAPATPTLSPVALLHYAALLLLAVGAVAFWWLRAPVLNPVTDPQGAQAIALVHTHRAKHTQTLLQGVNDMVRRRNESGKKARLGEWMVEKQAEGHYVVKIMFREQGSRNWIEREYSWQVDLGNKKVHALSMPAIDLMAEEDLAPLGSTTPLPVR